MVRRWISLLLALCLALGMMACVVSATDAGTEGTAQPTAEPTTEATAPPATETTPSPTDPPATETTPPATDPPATETTPPPTDPPATEATTPPTQPPVTSGSCGESMQWSFDTASGTLAISGSGAMADCTAQPWAEFTTQIKYAVIGAEVRSVGKGAFAGCTALTSVWFNGHAPGTIEPDAFQSVEATVFYPGLDISWTEEIFRNYGGSLTWEADIPSGVGGIFGNNFTWHLVDGTLTITGQGHLNGWSSGSNPPWYDYREQVKKVVMNGKIWSLYTGTFRDMVNLTEITWPQDINTLYSSAFSGCTSLKTVTIPNSVTEIFEYAFYNCTSLSEVSLPNALKTLGKSAFSKCSSLTAINLPYGVTSIGRNAFAYTGLKSIIIQDKITKLPEGIFQGCTRLSKVTFKGDITSVGAKAFQSCSSLTELTLPAGVKSIGEKAFEASALDRLVFSGDMPTISTEAFADVDASVFYPRDNSTWSQTRIQALEESYGGKLRCYAGTPDDFEEPTEPTEATAAPTETTPPTETAAPTEPAQTEPPTEAPAPDHGPDAEQGGDAEEKPTAPVAQEQPQTETEELGILDYWPVAVALVWFLGGSALTVWFFLIRPNRRR